MKVATVVSKAQEAILFDDLVETKSFYRALVRFHNICVYCGDGFRGNSTQEPVCIVGRMIGKLAEYIFVDEDEVIEQNTA